MRIQREKALLPMMLGMNKKMFSVLVTLFSASLTAFCRFAEPLGMAEPFDLLVAAILLTLYVAMPEVGTGCVIGESMRRSRAFGAGRPSVLSK